MKQRQFGESKQKCQERGKKSLESLVTKITKVNMINTFVITINMSGSTLPRV